MNTENTPSTALPETDVKLFLRGFLLRLIYGSLGLPILGLMIPGLLGEKRHILLGTIAFYLLICVAGGVYDAINGKVRKVQKPRMLDLLLVGVSLASLVILWLHR